MPDAHGFRSCLLPHSMKQPFTGICWFLVGVGVLGWTLRAHRPNVTDGVPKLDASLSEQAALDSFVPGKGFPISSSAEASPTAAAPMRPPISAVALAPRRSYGVSLANLTGALAPRRAYSVSWSNRVLLSKESPVGRPMSGRRGAEAAYPYESARPASSGFGRPSDHGVIQASHDLGGTSGFGTRKPVRDGPRRTQTPTMSDPPTDRLFEESRARLVQAP
jgi:hypothetical protein